MVIKQNHNESKNGFFFHASSKVISRQVTLKFFTSPCCINNSLHLARKYALIFVRGHYLFREANSFPRAKLEENCELRGTDNAQGQISVHVFKVKWRLLSLLSFKYFSQHRREICQSVICQSRQSLSIGFQRLSTFIGRLSNRFSFS